MEAVEQFDAWYRCHHPRLTTALMSMCGNGSMASDVADEALARALERWDRVGAMASPEAWTYRVAVNCLKRAKRRERIERSLLGRATRSANGSEAGRSAGPGGGWDLDLLAAISGLPPRQRTAIALHYVADLSIADTAEVMSIAPGSVTATLHQARRALNTRLTVEEDQP